MSSQQGFCLHSQYNRKYGNKTNNENQEGIAMPVKIRKKGEKYQVSTPGGIKSKGTTREKAKKQQRLINAIDHGWIPTKGYGVGKAKEKR